MSKSVFSDEHSYVQRYEDISRQPETKQNVKKISTSKKGILLGIAIIAVVTFGAGFFISHNKAASNVHSHYDSTLKDNNSYNLGYDDGYAGQDFNKLYSADQTYKKGYTNGEDDAAK